MVVKRLISVAVALSVLLIGGVVWSAGFAVDGVGVKALSMGGAFRGLADDWSACFWNPAGLGFMENSEINASLASILYLPKYNPNVLYGGLYQMGFKNGEDRYSETKFYFLPSFSGVYKLPESDIVLGMGGYVTYQLESHYWNLFEPLPGYNNLVGYPEDDFAPNILVYDFHPTVAKKFSENLCLGLGLSVNWVNYGLTQVDLIQTEYDVPHNNIPVDSKLSLDGWGVGFNLGMLYKLSPKVQMGISISSPVNIKAEGDIEYTAYLSADSVVDRIFTGGTLSSDPKAEATLKLPASAGIGFAYFSSDRLTFTFDGSWIGWSRWENLEIDLTGKDAFGNAAGDKTIAYQWNDVIKIALGCEYMYNDEFAMRSGYFYESSPVPNSTLNVLIPDIGAKHGFNFGLGYTFKNNIELGIAQQFVLSPGKTVDEIEDVNNDGTYDNLPGEYGNMRSGSHLSITYRF